MDIELIIPVLGAIASMAAGGLAATDLAQRVIKKLSGKAAPEEQSYSERLASLTASLHDSTKQVDAVLAELSHVAQERESTVKKLEENLANLEGREKDLQQRIEDLQKVPLPAVEHLAKLLEPGEKRSAWRDYILFGTGVVVSTTISIGLKLAGLG